MSVDDGLRSQFRTNLRRGFHWNSIETGGTGKGIPDSEFCCESIARWIEFKWTDGWAVTLLPEQVAWHVSRAERGGTSFVAVRRHHDGGVRKGPPQDELWLYHGKWAVELKAGGLRAGVPCLGVWEGGPARWDWPAVRRVLLA